MQQFDSGSRLPPHLVSVVMPALPMDMKDDSKNRNQKLVKLSTMAIPVFAIAFLVAADPFKLNPLALLFFTAIIALSLFIGMTQQKSFKKRKDYERKLYEMALQLSEKNVTLKEQVQIDPLTDLLNRRGLEKALGVEISRARRNMSKLYAALIDCDDFKQVNENFGHAVGDLVLQNIGKAIMKSIRPTDYGSRIGGDEFMVLLVDLEMEDAARVTERIRLAIKDQVVVHQSKNVPCTASIGVAELPLEVCSIEEMLTLTRAALKESKLLGKNKMSFTGLRKLAGGSDEDLDQMAQQLVTGEALRLVWQPIVRLENQKVAAYELLARGPKGPFELPRTFFRLAQEKNLLTSVDIRCLKVALAFAAKARPEFRYHINLFPSTLLDIPVEALDELLAMVPPQTRICLELSEQQFLGNHDCLISHVARFKERGFHVALDDVGFTRSSLESLIILAPNALKLHDNLTKGASTDVAKQKHLQRLVRIARSIDTELIAEGVETADDVQTLLDLGIDMGQGYYWAMPSAVEEATAEAATQV